MGGIETEICGGGDGELGNGLGKKKKKKSAEGWMPVRCPAGELSGRYLTSDK
jgi:hypothetical protein